MFKYFKKVKEYIKKDIIPGISKAGSSNIVQAISGGLMFTLPITLTAAVFSIFAKFPIPSIANWLSKTGLTVHFNAVLGGTLNLIAIFTVVSISYTYTKLLKKPNTNPLIAAFMALAAFIILIPQTVGKTSALSMTYLGSTGMFVGIILGLGIAKLYTILAQKKHLTIKLPDTVPPMVTESFRPLIVSFIILVLVLLIRIGFAVTPFKTFYAFINLIVTTPLMKLGSSIPAWIAIGTIANLLFFFGVHPNAINSALTPILLTMAYKNLEAYQKGITIPYKANLIVDSFLNNDAVGSTFSLLVVILVVAKSKRYRSLAKLAIVPNFFNINEPVIFGLPVMLNPFLLIPFFFSTIITGVIGWVGAATGFISYYNPAFVLALPWTTPKVIASFFTQGWQGVVLRVACFVVICFVYLPFVKMMDRTELKKERN
jgi:PTS system cellobiose-specific IIC component